MPLWLLGKKREPHNELSLKVLGNFRVSYLRAGVLGANSTTAVVADYRLVLSIYRNCILSLFQLPSDNQCIALVRLF